MLKRVHSIILLATAAALCSGGCKDRGKDADLARLDNQIMANQTDPAISSALQDQIMVDPTLSQQSNRNAVRPPETPTQAQYPLTQSPDGKAGAQAAASPAGVEEQAGCGAKFSYGAAWAQRLPALFMNYPGARVTDAAGQDVGDCRMRVVTFVTGDSPGRVLDWYRGRAMQGGYNAEHQLRQGDHILAGTNERDGGAFYLIVTPKPAGSEVALIVNRGA